MSVAPLSPRLRPVAFALLASVVLLTLPACSNVRTLIVGSNTGPKLDRTNERPRKPLDKKARRVVIAVVADAAGQVVDTRIVQSSGSASVDDYVRAYPPTEAAPTSVTTLEITYSAAEGFTAPKVLKVEPLSGSPGQ